MKKYVILHGHFYQPPREDPWTERIEYQESASPFCNWNKRIASECYAASGWSRVLDGDGFITSIVNNYQILSWNFGPTLLSWMQKEAPNLYRRIQEADRESRERLGFGNAMAQSFNHTILPLDTPQDARIQIEWGLIDFESRFNRKADGMWMPECAINYDVVDILIEKGLKFVVLSPWQADAVRKKGGSWEKLENRPAPSDRPFIIKRPQGTIAAFFYEPNLASAISFGHLLRSREGFEAALREALNNSEYPMVNIATDGEIYGHHEPYGDMCLAALKTYLEDDSDLVFTNYASYLAENPPADEVKLRLGDDGLGSSWSCAHGVGRWMRDCGCSTGAREGWNQAWRKPLRQAFDNLKAKADPLWKQIVEELTEQDALAVLTSYGRVLSGAETPEDFARSVLKDKASDGSSAVRLLCALEGAKFLQFMFTSCGWFFAELSGLEPVQNMRYAYRATELLDPEPDQHSGLLQTLLKDLKKALSNIPETGNGADILKKWVIPSISPETVTAAECFWRHIYNLPGNGTVSRRITSIEEENITVEGEVFFLHRSTNRKHQCPYRAVIDSQLFCPEVEILCGGKWEKISAGAMPMELQLEIRKAILQQTEEKLMQSIGNYAVQRLKGLSMVREMDVPLGSSGKQSLELSLYYGTLLQLTELKNLPPGQWPEVLKILDEILSYRPLLADNDNAVFVEDNAGKMISGIAEELQHKCSREVLEQLVRFITILHRHGYKPIRPFIQNMIYSLLEKRFWSEKEEAIHQEGISDADLLELALMMNINPQQFCGQP
ncbi:MAG: hypothetical protein CSA76_02235 [Spirochaetales bacterium]|nr:MAG: hypothetical protein CSA76_02235 [Spirochaetales bacterium]